MSFSRIAKATLALCLFATVAYAVNFNEDWPQHPDTYSYDLVVTNDGDGHNGSFTLTYNSGVSTETYVQYGSTAWNIRITSAGDWKLRYNTASMTTTFAAAALTEPPPSGIYTHYSGDSFGHYVITLLGGPPEPETIPSGGGLVHLKTATQVTTSGILGHRMDVGTDGRPTTDTLANVTNSLILAYPYSYDEGTNFLDCGIFGNDGNSPTPPSHSNTFGGTAFFDGVDDYIAADGILSDPTLLTVAAWIRSDTNLAARSIVFAHRDIVEEFIMLGINTSGTLVMQIRGHIDTQQFVTGTNTYLGEWVHAAGTINRTSNEYILYENGIATVTNTYDWTGQTMSSTQQRIGHYDTTTAFNEFCGDMGEIRVYTSVLTPSEISALANRTAPTYE